MECNSPGTKLNDKSEGPQNDRDASGWLPQPNTVFRIAGGHTASRCYFFLLHKKKPKKKKKAGQINICCPKEHKTILETKENNKKFLFIKEENEHNTYIEDLRTHLINPNNHQFLQNLTPRTKTIVIINFLNKTQR
jgi:hypothetical protein